MKEKLIEFLRSLSKFDAGLYLRILHRINNQKKYLKKFPDDRKFIEYVYEMRLGRKPELDNPKRFTEKMQWLKLNYRNPLFTKCVDKFLVREYIESKGYGELLNELYAHITDVDELDVDKLPDRFVVKAAHSSSMNYVCTDKNSVNWKSKKKIFKLWLEHDLYLDGREWAYKNLKPSIVVEKYLEDDSGYLRDYKFVCINGEVKLIFADVDRYSDHKRACYDADWNKVDIVTDCKTTDVKRPDNLEEMEKIAKDLSADFPFVRVDLYNCNGKIYFGELTFYPWGGIIQFTPDTFDFEFGDMIELPEKII